MRKEGLYEKYEEIASKGLDRPRRIYRLLKKFDGNVEKVVERLQSGECHKKRGSRSHSHEKSQGC